GGCWGYSCCGCWGGYSGCYGSCYGCWGCNGYSYPAQMGAPPAGAPKEGEQLQVPPKKSALRQFGDNQAHLLVELPVNAKLYVDDHLMKSTASRRSFVTPELQPGQTYYYVLRAEVDLDGKTVSETKRVTVRAGQQIQASFGDLETESTARAEVSADR